MLEDTDSRKSLFLFKREGMYDTLVFSTHFTVHRRSWNVNPLMNPDKRYGITLRE